MAKITFKFEDGHVEQNFDVQKGDTILEITEAHDIELQHNCGGVCGCSTCHVYIEQGMEELEEISDREEDYIDRAENPKINSRLACQCEILNDEAEIVVTIPPQDFLGH